MLVVALERLLFNREFPVVAVLKGLVVAGFDWLAVFELLNGFPGAWIACWLPNSGLGVPWFGGVLPKVGLFPKLDGWFAPCVPCVPNRGVFCELWFPPRFNPWPPCPPCPLLKIEFPVAGWFLLPNRLPANPWLAAWLPNIPPPGAWFVLVFCPALPNSGLLGWFGWFGNQTLEMR